VSPILLVAALGCHHRRNVDNALTTAGLGEGQGGLHAAASSGASAEDAAVAELVANFARVHFATDSATLDRSAQDALTANAAILSDHATVRVEIEGHADERGTVDYNLALGQRRAATVERWLVGQGVPPSRLRVTTMGEERPLVAAGTEVAWAENRRAEFRVITGAAEVRGTVQ
jgi:peptidoglycan-associated lipoprotein